MRSIMRCSRPGRDGMILPLHFSPTTRKKKRRGTEGGHIGMFLSMKALPRRIGSAFGQGTGGMGYLHFKNAANLRSTDQMGLRNCGFKNRTRKGLCKKNGIDGK